MSKATFDSTKPEASGSFVSSDMRNNYQAIYQGDIAALRPRAQTSPDMTVAVAGTLVEGFYSQVYSDDLVVPLTVAAANSPTVIAPVSNSRIDVLHVSGTPTGALHWTVGAEAASPTIPVIPSGTLPICALYCKTTMNRILNYEDKDTDATEGYLYRDLRPIIRASSNKIVDIRNTISYAMKDNATSKAIPIDDSVPEITEGDEYMTCSITPKNVNNLLKIEVTIVLNEDTAADNKISAALFQDSDQYALAAVWGTTAGGDHVVTLSFTHFMTAGTTSETTFKVHAGGDATAQITMNGVNGGEIFNGVCASSIIITEIRA